MIAAAATDEDTHTFTEDFEAMDITDTSDADSKKATIDALLDDGWYPVDNNRAYMNVDTTQEVYQFATVMGDDSNHYLRLNTPKSNSDNYKLGLGRLFPGQGISVRGVWEIDFRFMPYYKSTTPVQFNFSMNTYENRQLTADEETIAQHNIISAYNNKMYMGYRDYLPLYEGDGIPQGRLDGNLPLDWYDVKVIVNCDARYYSVELSHDGKLFARRSPINFGEDESIGFFKLSALGMKVKGNNSPAAVYVDDITIKPAEKETLIYNEDFEAFSTSDPVSDGITTGEADEDVSGHSYFEGFTPWRAHADIGSSYEIADDPDLGSQVVRLGGEEIGSGLIYMPALEKLVDDVTQTARGLVKTSFKIKPEDINSSVTVNVIGDHTQDITSEDAIAFEIANNDGTPAVVKADETFAELDTNTWYNVDLVFDVTSGKVTTTVTDFNSEEEIVSFVKEVNAVKDERALKGIMFNVPAGSYVLADDIVIEYYASKPVIGKIAAIDQFGKPLTDTSDITAALWAIRIPVGCALDPDTANTDTIKIVDEYGEEIQYRGSTASNSYTLYFDSLLARGTNYQITVPATIANTSGDELGSEYKLKFKTTDKMSDLMRISAIKAGDEAVESITDITAGSTVNVDVIYANSTEDAINATAVMVFRNSNGDIVKLLASSLDEPIEAGAFGPKQTGEDGLSFEFEVPSDLDMSVIGDVSVFLWDGFEDNIPYCPKVSIEKQ